MNECVEDHMFDGEASGGEGGWTGSSGGQSLPPMGANLGSAISSSLDELARGQSGAMLGGFDKNLFHQREDLIHTLAKSILSDGGLQGFAIPQASHNPLSPSTRSKPVNSKQGTDVSRIMSGQPLDSGEGGGGHTGKLQQSRSSASGDGHEIGG